MRCECPELRRCCFCFPLRQGLLVWAYLKFIMELVVMRYFIRTICNLVTFAQFVWSKNTHDTHYYHTGIVTAGLTIVSIALFLTVIDGIFIAVFIIAAHSKRHVLMKVYYIYLLVILGLTTLIYLLIIGLQLFVYEIFYYATMYWQFVIIGFVIQFINIVIQIYFILLVRSETIKLSGDWGFRFQNNAAEAECTMITPTEYENTVEIPVKDCQIQIRDESVNVKEIIPTDV